MADKMQKGHYVKINIARGKTINVIITDIEHKWRAKKYPYVIKFKDPCSNKTFYGKQGSLLYSDNPGTIFISEKHDKGDQCIAEFEDIQKDRQDKKDNLLKENLAALRKFDIKVGDVIVFGYSNGNVQEVVAGVNWKTGKIAIERFSSSDKKKYLDQIENWGFTREMLRRQYPGMDWSRKVDRSKRWLHAKNIRKVVAQPKTASREVTAKSLLEEVRALQNELRK